MGAAPAVTVLGIVVAAALPIVAWSRVDAQEPAPRPKPDTTGKETPGTAPEARSNATQESPRPKLPPRAAIGGVRQLETTSTIVFPGREAEPHELVATFAFPERARLALRALEGRGASARELRFRYGAEVFTATSERASSPLAGAARLDVLADLELRTALFLWPDGVDWKGDGLAREAARGELGTLRAKLPRADQPPTELELVGPDGTSLVAFRNVTWSEERGRRWPATLEAWRGAALAFRETVSLRDTAHTYVDSYFLPADRRTEPLEKDRLFGRVRDTDLPRFAARRVALPAGLAWTNARPELERLTREWTEALKPKGLALDPNWTVEFGPGGEPCALLVRLAKEPAALPEGFEWAGGTPGRVVALEGLESVAGVDFARLREGLPEKARPKTPYVRIPAQPGGVLVVLPWTKGE